jgi:hypothetical protein
MSAGSVSLESALRTCKVNTGWADRVESDRFLNPNNMVCPVWNGVDTAGRQVCADSYYTKRAGCNSAEDRVAVENNVSRPQYMEYITLAANGIRGNIYGNVMSHTDSVMRSKDLQNVHKLTGQFGNVTGFGAEIYPGCGLNRYRDAMSQQAQQMRQAQASQHGHEAYTTRNMAGLA